MHPSKSSVDKMNLKAMFLHILYIHKKIGHTPLANTIYKKSRGPWSWSDHSFVDIMLKKIIFSLCHSKQWLGLSEISDSWQHKKNLGKFCYYFCKLQHRVKFLHTPFHPYAVSLVQKFIHLHVALLHWQLGCNSFYPAAVF